MPKYLIERDTLEKIADSLRSLKCTDELILVGNFASEVEGVGNTLKGLIEGSVEDVIIPHGATAIKAYTFTGCGALKSIIIPDTVTSIGSTAFSWCKALTSIKIPKNVSSIGSYAFVNCSSCLIYDFSNHINAPALADNTVFTGINANAKIIVPEGLYNNFCHATQWSDLHHNLVSIGESGMNNVTVETIWLMSSGSYRYISGKSVPLKAYYKINDGEAVEFSYNTPAFGGLRFVQMYDGDTGYYMSASGTLSFSIPGTYEIWVEDSSTGIKYYRRIIEVSA